MNDPSLELERLAANVASARGELTQSVETLGAAVNLKERLKTELAEHPVKWGAVALASGFVASKALPILWRFTRSSVGLSLLRGLSANIIPLTALVTERMRTNRVATNSDAESV